VKKLLLAIFAAIWFLASPAYADSVRVKTQAAFTNPTNGVNAVPAEAYYDFQGPSQNIVVSVGGKTCTLQSSGNISGGKPGGCNYTINVSPTGGISGTGDCTTDIASACK
jgi:hypothetical protein